VEGYFNIAEHRSESKEWINRYVYRNMEETSVGM